MFRRGPGAKKAELAEIAHRECGLTPTMALNLSRDALISRIRQTREALKSEQDPVKVKPKNFHNMKLAELKAEAVLLSLAPRIAEPRLIRCGVDGNEVVMLGKVVSCERKEEGAAGGKKSLS